ncbi:hypothetical protein [Kordiimonas marina]|uniref:hypothetical protein n=1 Tax=Kordiimonas marina TaxID=2872312 RepID=UPI001FF3EC61|nr:hypothetical protein [Kordiimonas marina]MCJ9428067.1 hypothetical protein [Kordiimonas marina]
MLSDPLYPLHPILNSQALLNAYLSGGSTGILPSWADAKQQVYLAEWRRRPDWPDHLHRKYQDALLGCGVGNQGGPDAGLGNGNAGSSAEGPLAEHLFALFERFHDRYLEWHGLRLCVKRKHFAAWQGELAELSPLPFIAFGLWRRYGRYRDSYAERKAYSQHLEPFRHSLLIGPHSQLLEKLGRERGYNDPHVHLNGTTEADAVWLHALDRYGEFSADLKQQFTSGPDPDALKLNEVQIARELLLQIDVTLTPELLLERIRIARRLRHALCFWAYGHTKSPEALHANKGNTQPNLQTIIAGGWPQGTEQPVWRYHPLRTFGAEPPGASPTMAELAMYIRLYDILGDRRHTLRPQVARALHLYLLILNGTFLPICVQKIAYKGFDQFQKFTVSGARNSVENGYEARFHQIGPKAHADVRIFEGRFAPKADRQKLISLLSKIIKGYRSYLLALENGGAAMGQTPEPLPKDTIELSQKTQGLQLRLTAHFIKKNELRTKMPEREHRFARLRNDLDKQWRHLDFARRTFPAARYFINSIDAASNELHTPPEVFAPLYRCAREAGLSYATYHVGEDFNHLVSGIRAVKEAIEFLDYRPGNRLGHATAIGIAPQLWLERMPQTIHMEKGEWLDNLVFAWSVLRAEPEFHGVVAKAEDEITRLVQQIYVGLKVSDSELLGLVLAGAAPLLHQAWQLRHLDPRYFDDKGPQLGSMSAHERALHIDAKKDAPIAYQVRRFYETPRCVKTSGEKTLIQSDFFPAAALVKMQQVVLQEVCRRKVVIETMLSSNVSISFYRGYGEHHLRRWLGLDPTFKDEPRPTIILASDDPGIFATNIRNEYAHALRLLHKACDVKVGDAEKTLIDLMKNSETYSFREGGTV